MCIVVEKEVKFMANKSIKVSEETYREIKKRAKEKMQSIKAVVHLAMQCKSLIKGIHKEAVRRVKAKERK